MRKIAGITNLARKIALIPYSLLFIPVIAIGVVTVRMTDRGDDGGFFAIAAAGLLPVILYWFGIQWCRYVVGTISAIILFVWPILAFHEPARGPEFWLISVLVWVAFAFSALISFTPNRAAAIVP